VTKGEGAIRREVGSRCLVGKLWADRLANKEAFKTISSRILLVQWFQRIARQFVAIRVC
jgi:hypothetical protein